MIFDCQDYRDFLKETLSQRIARNPRYSLRSMAHALDINPGSLSRIFKGSKNLSDRKAAKVAQALQLDPDGQEYFRLLVHLEKLSDQKLRQETRERLMRIQNSKNLAGKQKNLSSEAFLVISEWYHFPILEMTGIKGLKLTAKSAADRLGIKLIEAEMAIDRMIKLNLLAKDRQGKFVKTEHTLLAQSADPSKALRKFHRQMLKKAEESLENQSPKEKFVGSQTFAVDPRLFAQMFEAMDHFLLEMAQTADRSQNNKDVYHLGLQFFKLTHSEGKIQ